jgi:hypothetical protein
MPVEKLIIFLRFHVEQWNIPKEGLINPKNHPIPMINYRLVIKIVCLTTQFQLLTTVDQSGIPNHPITDD